MGAMTSPNAQGQPSSAPAPSRSGLAVDDTLLLEAARIALVDAGERLAGILRELPTTDTPIPGSEWTVRDAAAHIVSWAPDFAAMAVGMPSPLLSIDRDTIAAENARRLATVPTKEPAALASAVLDAARLTAEAMVGPAERTVGFHAGIRQDVAGLAGVVLGEMLLHGYDIACTVGAPWSILPEDVALVLHGHGAAFPEMVDRVTTRGLTVSYDIDLGRAGRLGVGFVDGVFAVTDPAAAAEPATCRIEACPRAFLLVSTGRLSVWTAVSLGLWRGAGTRPGLASTYPRHFLTV
jgi:uncharacterized protein (TIGR03083 family)